MKTDGNWLDNFCSVFTVQKPVDSICIVDSNLLKKYENDFQYFNNIEKHADIKP